MTSGRWRQARWLLPLVFLPGLIPALVPAAAQADAFPLLTVVAMIVSVVPLLLLNRPADETLWAWALLGLFVLAYFAQTFLVSRYLLDRLFVQTQLNPEWTWLSSRVLVDAYGWIVLAYTVLCLSVAALLRLGRQADRLRQWPAVPVPARHVAGWLTVCVAVSSSTLIVRGSLGLGVMGVEATTRLPFALDTLLFRLHSHLLPMAILLGVWLSDRTRDPVLRWSAVALVFMHALGLALVSTSKAAMVHAAVPLAAMWLLSGRFTRARQMTVAAAMLALVLMYPVFTALRVARMAGAGPVAAAAAPERPLRTRIAQTSRAIALRAIGASGVWYALRYAEQAPSLAMPRAPRADPLVIYFTRDVVGVSTPADFRSPGLTGAFLLVAGPAGVIAGWTVVPLAAWLIWGRLRRLRTAPVLMAMFLLQLLIDVSEGTLQWQGLVTFAVAATLVETAYRVVLAPRAAEVPA